MDGQEYQMEMMKMLREVGLLCVELVVGDEGVGAWWCVLEAAVFRVLWQNVVQQQDGVDRSLICVHTYARTDVPEGSLCLVARLGLPQLLEVPVSACARVNQLLGPCFVSSSRLLCEGCKSDDDIADCFAVCVVGCACCLVRCLARSSALTSPAVFFVPGVVPSCTLKHALHVSRVLLFLG